VPALLEQHLRNFHALMRGRNAMGAQHFRYFFPAASGF
jgi:hypothetical protein